MGQRLTNSSQVATITQLFNKISMYRMYYVRLVHAPIPAKMMSFSIVMHSSVMLLFVTRKIVSRGKVGVTQLLLSTMSENSILASEGLSISDLRKRGVSPREIREAGFTCEQMFVHMGVHMLLTAGFTLDDFVAANIPFSAIADHMPMEALVVSKKFPMSVLIQRYSLMSLRKLVTVKDFLSLEFMTPAMLKEHGFTDADIAACGLSNAPMLGPPGCTPMQPYHARRMKINEEWMKTENRANGLFLTVKYTLLPLEEAASWRANPYDFPGHGPRIAYEGSGKLCPRCGRMFVLVEKRSSSDPGIPEVQGKWICEEPTCGMMKEERMIGDGTIF